MTHNKKLEKIVCSHSFVSITIKDDAHLFTLENDTIITIKGTVLDIPINIDISEVYQSDTILRFVFVDGQTNDIALAMPSSSVFARDGKGAFAYAD